MKKRTLVISDIHGCIEEFKALLKQSHYHPNKDILLLLGDYVDRGLKSKETVEFVMELVSNCGAIALQGNHDHRFVKIATNNASDAETEKFLSKGGPDTIQSYLSLKTKIDIDNLDYYKQRIMNVYDDHIQFLSELPYYHEDDNYIYVHAGLNPLYDNWYDQPIHDFLYIREDFYKHKMVVKKVVIFGHTITTKLHSLPDVWYGGDKIGIDGGCAFGHQLNCLEIIEGRINKVYVEQSRSSKLT